MHLSSTLFLSLSLALATSVSADTVPHSSPLGLKEKPAKASKRSIGSVLETRQSCQGTCQSCFGPTFIDCPDSVIYCYDPTIGPASDQCSPGGSSPPSPTSPDSPVSTDTCYQEGASCVSCFGVGHLSCPAGSDFDCYDTSVYSEAEGCSDDVPAPSSTGSSPPAASSGSASQCAAIYGPGNVPCGDGYCYNPDIGESCCGDGRYCSAGTECVLRGDEYRCADEDSPASSTTEAATTRTSPGIVIPTNFDDDEETTSSAERTTRTTSSRTTSTTSGAAAASTTSEFGNAAPALLEKEAGLAAGVMAGLLALMGLL